MLGDSPCPYHLVHDMPGIEIFRSSDVSTDCDQCQQRVDLLKGGVCSRCRRILCYRHLHGSFVRRLLADIRNDVVCVSCRLKA